MHTLDRPRQKISVPDLQKCRCWLTDDGCLQRDHVLASAAPSRHLCTFSSSYDSTGVVAAAVTPADLMLSDCSESGLTDL